MYDFPVFSLRGGLGPVHAFEWLTASRRWQMYAGRSLCVGLLLLALAFAWNNPADRSNRATLKGQAEIGRAFHDALVSIELLIVLLTAPAATAGAICLDKARGTLLHVLVTDLSDSEIVLGKLAARLVPVLGLVGASLPVMAISTLLGGVDPVALTGSFLVLLSLAVLGCTLALTLSVWGKKTHEVLLATYLVWVVWILLPPLCFDGPTRLPPPWVVRSNPFALTVAAHDPSSAASPGLGDQLLFSIAALVVSAALLALTVAQLRPVIIGQWGRAEGGQKRTSLERIANARLFGSRWAWLGPTLDRNPVLWLEWHRRRPSRWVAVIWGIYVVLAASFSALAIELAWFPNGPGVPEVPVTVNVLQVAFGLLLVCVTSASSMAEERARGSLDVLLATPLSTAAIVWGKWWGACRSLIWVALLPTLVAGALAYHSGRWAGPALVLGLVLAYGAALNSLGLLLATCVPQVGRVLGLCVSAYVGVTIGLIATVFALVPHRPDYEPIAIGVVMGSPLYGIGLLSAAIVETRPNLWPNSAYGAVFWTLEYMTAAGFLLVATLLVFERGLGRIPDCLAPRRIASAGKTHRKPTGVDHVARFRDGEVPSEPTVSRVE